MLRKRSRYQQQAAAEFSLVQTGGVIVINAVKAVVLSLLILIVISLIFTLTEISESVMTYLAGGASVIGLLVITFMTGRKIRSRGLIVGGGTGIVFVLLLMITAYFLPIEFSPGLHIITKLFLGFIFGSIGGVIGVNF